MLTSPPSGSTALGRLAALACLLLSLAGDPAGASATGPVRLPDIAMGPEAGQWRVDYRFEHPVAAFRFARPDARGRRAARWQPLDADFEITLEGDEEVVRRKDGGRFERVGFRMPPRYETLDKDYAPFSPFGDGGLLVHTGRFHACAERCDLADGGPPSWRLEARPGPGQWLIQGGARHAGPVAFEEGGAGSKLYVGAAEPVQTNEVIAVIDARFPPAARELLHTLFPRLMAWFSARLGSLQQTPMLFASNDEAHPGGGYGHQGGTLPGQVFVHLYGRPPGEDPQALASRLAFFFAHEAAHLFQRTELTAAGTPDWIHEGGAEALADIALAHLDLAPASALQARRKAASEACAAALSQGPLPQARARGDFGASYACGHLFQLAVHEAASGRRGEQRDLASVWADFLSRIEAGQPWNESTFLDSIEALTSASLRRAIESLAHEPQPDPAAAIAALIRVDEASGDPASD